MLFFNFLLYNQVIIRITGFREIRFPNGDNKNSINRFLVILNPLMTILFSSRDLEENKNKNNPDDIKKSITKFFSSCQHRIHR